jgi:hypothetical protein
MIAYQYTTRDRTPTGGQSVVGLDPASVSNQADGAAGQPLAPFAGHIARWTLLVSRVAASHSAGADLARPVKENCAATSPYARRAARH